MTKFLKALAILALSLIPLQTMAAEESFTDHRLALQVSDNDPQKMTTVLNVAANVTRHYESIGETVEIRIVAFNAGLHMLRTDHLSGSGTPQFIWSLDA